MGHQLASRHTSKSFTGTGAAGALTVSSGEAVTVYGITVTTAADAIFTVTDANDNLIFTIDPAAATTFSHEVCWKADAGIKVQSSVADGEVVVFHSASGL